jgi:peptidyl-prolyl cis-trans isomerase B (cyclophilin B)
MTPCSCSPSCSSSSSSSRAAALLALALLAPIGVARAGTEEVAVLRAPQGQIVWRFLPREAPAHVAQVKRLIASGFYDGTTFHRVIPHFVVQGGDPNSRNDDRSDDGDGEADTRLKAEFSERLHYRPGTVGMARDADPDSGSCQFFIALEDLPRLDRRYTIFAEVVEGLEVARRIASLPRDANDNPLERVPVTLRLEKRSLPDAIVSRDPGRTGSGEVLTGPDKPRPYDPGNPLWAPPSLERAPARGEGELARVRLDVALDAAGRVLDVRFPRADTPDALRLQAMAMAWSFSPARYDGKPWKTRFEIDADGGNFGAPMGGGAPLDAQKTAGLEAPRPQVRVTLPAGVPPPAKPARLRLTIGADGAVSDAALLESCGTPSLDAAALDAARALAFAPAARPRPGKEPEPIAVYLNVESRFLAPSP